MLRRVLAAALACVIAGGGSLALAACAIECQHESDPHGQSTIVQAEPLASGSPHSCHEAAPADASDVFARGSQECTHSGPDAPPASIKRALSDRSHGGGALALADALAPERPVAAFVRYPLVESRYRQHGPATLVALRI